MVQFDACKSAHTVRLPQVRPLSTVRRCLQCNCADNHIVHSKNFFVGKSLIVQPLQADQSLLVTISGCEPTGRLREQWEYEQHSDEEDCLQRRRDSPDEACAPSVGNGIEPIRSPVDEHDT